jgi:RNA polymerase subunit RPABC4/transcription elongation factor Spt4
MGLVQCPDCGNEVSTRAAACPKCGGPVQATAQSPDVQAVADTGVAATGAKTCPSCRKAVDPRAYKCPYCKHALRTTPGVWGCLVLIVLFTILMMATIR